MRIVASILFAIAASPAVAAPIYVTAARMIDPASGKAIADPAVIIDDGKVAAVGTKATLGAPDGAEIVDLRAKPSFPA